jgi:predicted transcriptional regulator
VTDAKPEGVREAQVQTGIRLSESLVERVDRIAEAMSQPGLTLTRSDVLRMAVHKGVDQLEAEREKR